MKSELTVECFSEISIQEQQELNGGILPFLAAVAIIAIAEAVRDWDNFKNGLMGRPEEEQD